MNPNLQALLGEALIKTADLLDALEQENRALAAVASQTKSAANAAEIDTVATLISAHQGVPINDDLKTKVAEMPSEFRQLLNEFSQKTASSDFGSSADKHGAGSTQSDDPSGWDTFGNWILSTPD